MNNNILTDNAKTYIKMFEDDTKKYAKNLNRDIILNKCSNADAVHFRQTNYKGYKKYCNKKRPVINVAFTKNTVCFTFKYSYKKHYFKFADYGIKWVVDKEDYLPYLQISY